MVKLIGLLVLCGLLFGGGLAGALYLRPPADTDGAETTKTDEIESIDDLPVPLRDSPMGAEEVFRFAASIRGRQRDLDRRQEQIERDESRVKMLQEDLRAERTELDGLLAKLKESLDNSQILLEAIQTERSQLEQEKSAAAETLSEVQKNKQATDANEMGNLKQVARWLDGMTEDQAAQYLKQLANDGKMDMAIKLLANLEERNASKLLSALDDPALAVELTAEFRKYQRPVKER